MAGQENPTATENRFSLSDVQVFIALFWFFGFLVFMQDNSKNLLQYVVQLYCLKTQDEGHGDYDLPDPYAILAAGQVSHPYHRRASFPFSSVLGLANDVIV